MKVFSTTTYAICLSLGVISTMTATDYYEFTNSDDGVKGVTDKNYRLCGERVPTFRTHGGKLNYSSSYPCLPSESSCSNDTSSTVLPLNSIYLMCPTEYDQGGGDSFVIGIDETNFSTAVIKNPQIGKYKFVNGNSESDSISLVAATFKNCNATLFIENSYGNYTFLFDFTNDLKDDDIRINLTQSQTAWLIIQQNPEDNFMAFSIDAISNVKHTELDYKNLSDELLIWKIITLAFALLAFVIFVLMLILIKVGSGQTTTRFTIDSALEEDMVVTKNVSKLESEYSLKPGEK